MVELSYLTINGIIVVTRNVLQSKTRLSIKTSIQRNLNQLVAGKTALIIAHRLSTLRQADRILVLRDGQIAESGNHESLLLQDGIYADLWRVQLGEGDQKPQMSNQKL